jgi:type VI secretion system secreted protein Hcp
MAFDVYLQIDGIKGESQDDKHKDWVKYFDIELENVLIGMVKPHLGGDDSYLSEIVSLKYSKIKWKYTQQKIGGGGGGNTAGGWDLAANKVV